MKKKIAKKLIIILNIINSILIVYLLSKKKENINFKKNTVENKTEKIKINKMSDFDFDISLMNVGPLEVNCYLIADKKSKKALVVDPGGNPEIILSKIEKNNYELESIILTHAHFDHILGVYGLKKKTNAKIYLHNKDFGLWKMLPIQVKMFGQSFPPEETLLPDPDQFLNDEDSIYLNGNVVAKVIHTPGHSPGSICLYFEQIKKLYSGDTLFRQSVGRTDLWEGSFNDIRNSIKEKLFKLDDSVDVFPGHGPSTNIGYEKKHNYSI